MEIQRDIYVERLKRRMGNQQIKVITGIRRCGKSYLLFRLFKRFLLEQGVPPDHIIEIEFDRRRNTPLLSPDAACAFIDSRLGKEGKYYLLLDEVQLLEDFESVLNDYLHIDNLDIYVTGSNSKFLSTDIITEFAGRGDEVHVLPLSYREFLPAASGIENPWSDYLTFGGLPQVLTRQSDADKSEYLKSLFQKVYIKDVIRRNKIKHHPEEIEELLEILASSVGSLTNPLNLENAFRSIKKTAISRGTLGKYCRCLEEAFLIHKARRYDVKGKKYINTPLKYYFEDVGLRNALLNFRQTEENHLMENIVYNELRFRGYNVDVGVVEMRDHSAKLDRKALEIDFVANLGSKRYYIQSAFTMPDDAKREQENRPLRHTGDSFRKIIVTGDNTRICRNNDGHTIMNIQDFLLNPDSLDL